MFKKQRRITGVLFKNNHAGLLLNSQGNIIMNFGEKVKRFFSMTDQNSTIQTQMMEKIELLKMLKLKLKETIRTVEHLVEITFVRLLKIKNCLALQ